MSGDNNKSMKNYPACKELDLVMLHDCKFIILNTDDDSHISRDGTCYKVLFCGLTVFQFSKCQTVWTKVSIDVLSKLFALVIANS